MYGGLITRNGMSGVSLPVSRPTGRGLLVGSAAARVDPAAWLNRLGCPCIEMDDPYTAIAELSRRPALYSTMVISLGTIFPEELQVISAVKRRFPSVEIWLARTEGRPAMLDEAMRLGADGFIAEDGLHRLPPPQPPQQPAKSPEATPREEMQMSEPVLTVDELRALLDELPSGKA